jgi:hypothetical protein
MPAWPEKILCRRFVPDPVTGKLVPVGERIEFIDGRLVPPATQFLKGPVPWDWVARAAALPGKAPLLVGLSLWRLKGLKPGRDTVMLDNAALEPFRIDPAAKSRAVRALEKAGLVSVTRRKGRFPRVTLLVTGDEPDAV